MAYRTRSSAGGALTASRYTSDPLCERLIRSSHGSGSLFRASRRSLDRHGPARGLFRGANHGRTGFAPRHPTGLHRAAGAHLSGCVGRGIFDVRAPKRWRRRMLRLEPRRSGAPHGHARKWKLQQRIRRRGVGLRAAKRRCDRVLGQERPRPGAGHSRGIGGELRAGESGVGARLRGPDRRVVECWGNASPACAPAV